MSVNLGSLLGISPAGISVTLAEGVVKAIIESDEVRALEPGQSHIVVKDAIKSHHREDGSCVHLDLVARVTFP